MRNLHLVLIFDPTDGSTMIKAYTKREYAEEEANRLRFWGLDTQVVTVKISK